MTIQTTGSNGLIYKILQRAFSESHINENIMFNVINTKNLKKEYREAIKKDYDISDVDESDIMICFEVKNTEAKPTKEQTTDKEETVEQAPKEDVKKAEEKPQDDEGKKEDGSFGLNESEEEKQPTTIEKDDDIGDLKQKIIKAVARSLYVQNIDEVKLYDVDFNNGKTFYIKANLRK